MINEPGPNTGLKLDIYDISYQLLTILKYRLSTALKYWLSVIDNPQISVIGYPQILVIGYLHFPVSVHPWYYHKGFGLIWFYFVSFFIFLAIVLLFSIVGIV